MIRMDRLFLKTCQFQRYLGTKSCMSARNVSSLMFRHSRGQTGRPTNALENSHLRTSADRWKCLAFKGIRNHQDYLILRREMSTVYKILSRPRTQMEKLTNGMDILSTRSGKLRFFSSSSARAQKSSDGKEDGKEQEKDSGSSLIATLIAICGGLLFFTLITGDQQTQTKTVTWNEFYHDLLSKGEVDRIKIREYDQQAYIVLQPGAIVRGRQLARNEYLTLNLANVDSFEIKLREAEAQLGISSQGGIPVEYMKKNEMADALVLILILAVAWTFLRGMGKKIGNPMDPYNAMRKAKFIRGDRLKDASGKGITFNDVKGLQEAKVEIMEFVDFLKRPQKYKDLGGKIPKGALLLGPPGCGKTLLAKAVAAESDVPFLAMAGSEFVEMIGGLGASRVRDLFKEAGNKAPCIIYIDEIDAIGKKRGGGVENSEEEQTLNQLLVEMDGMSSKESVILMASTNRPDVLDKALLRPGRFDRHIQIELPTLLERKDIFEMYLRKLKLARSESTYSERLSQLSPGMSGADIANVCNEAALHAARVKKTQIDEDDFEYAVERVVAGVAKKTKVLSQQEKKVVAYHEAGHALLGWLLEHTDTLLKVTIVPRTSNALGFAQYMPTDKHLFSKDELFDKMCMGLGGRVAEAIIFNRVTSGAQDDLKKVTAMASAQIKQLGMSDEIGHLSFPNSEEGTRPYSKHMQQLIDMEITRLVTRAYQQTELILTRNKEMLRVVAEALVEKESLSYTDMEQLIGPPPYRNKVNMAWSKDTTG